MNSIGELEWFAANSNAAREVAMRRLKDVQEDNAALHNDIEFIKSHWLDLFYKSSKNFLV